jgi:hypothetical protein
MLDAVDQILEIVCNAQHGVRQIGLGIAHVRHGGPLLRQHREWGKSRLNSHVG